MTINIKPTLIKLIVANPQPQTRSEAVLLAAMAALSHTNPTPSIKTIAQASGLSIMAVVKVAEPLCDRGIVEIQ